MTGIHTHSVLTGLIGYPLGHSFSPVIHNAAFNALNIDGKYQLYPIAPFPEGQAELVKLLEQVKAGLINGLNVTIPHKQNVIPMLDKLTAASQRIGAVNTIFAQDGLLIGDNTDAPGFIADLQRLSPDLQAPVLVLGAGGSARAVVDSLLQLNCTMYIASRRVEQAQALAQSLLQNRGNCLGQISPIELNPATLSPVIQICRLVINTTPVGMFPNVDATPWPDATPFQKGAVIYDLVYNPVETKLVRQALLQGLNAASGAGMLVEQAALAFERWTGQTAPRPVMWHAIQSHLSNR
jgi:shikimate dehydrogenase